MKKTLFIGLLFLSITTAQAQLMGKLNRAANTVETANKAGKLVKGATDKAGKAGKAGGAPAGLKLDWTQYPMTPAITFQSLLYGTTDGRLDNYTATFIPNRTASGKAVDPIGDQSEYLKIKIFKDGQYQNYFEYDGGQAFDEGRKVKYNWPKNRYQRNGEWVGWSESFITQWGAGNYRLDFYAGDKMFYSFDFELAKLTNNDPYASMKEMWVTRGPWNNFAYLNHANTGNLVFGFYLTHEEFMPNPSDARKTNKAVKWQVKMLKDGKPFAQHYGNGPNTAQVQQAKWGEQMCAFKLVDKPGEIKFANLADGAYKIELTVEGEAKPRNYNFTVKDKKIVLIPEQDRARNTDPTRLIEGWNDYFWLKLEK